MLFPEPSAPAIKPRKYQLDAFKAVQTYLEYREGNPCVVLPTGAGKTVLIVLICQWVQSWGGRVLILAHVKELLQQAADELNQMCPELHVGVYSAGLDRREKTAAITVAGIQSIYKQAAEFEPWDVVIGDECHLWPPEGDGMYRSFLKALQEINKNVRFIGLTATPYRLSSGDLCGPEELLRAICYEIGVTDLIKQGFLSPLTSKRVQEFDASSLHIRGGEFVPEEVSLLMQANGATEAAVEQIKERTKDRRSVLIFCANVEHAIDVRNLLDGEMVTGETPDRDKILKRFKAGEFKYLTNVGVLTTGFNARNVDCVVLLRPTNSPGLYYQMVGRGFRLADGKSDCLVLDFGGNIQRHGPINAIVPKKKPGKSKAGPPATKVCPTCDEVVLAGVRTCVACGHIWPLVREASHDASYSDDSILADDETELPVYEVRYSRHEKKDVPPDHPATLRVDYITTKSLASSWRNNGTISEWVCIEHEQAFVRSKAVLWWKARSNDPFPKTALRAAEIGEGGGLAIPTSITIQPDPKNKKYNRIKSVVLGPKPEPAELCECGGEGCDKCNFEFEAPETESSVDWGDLPF